MSIDKKERLILTAGLSLTLALGFSLQYVKVPFTKQNVTIKKVPIEVHCLKNGDFDNKFSLPDGCRLSLDENGRIFAYQEIFEEETTEISLSDYLTYELSKGKK